MSENDYGRYYVDDNLPKKEEGKNEEILFNAFDILLFDTDIDSEKEKKIKNLKEKVKKDKKSDKTKTK